MFYPKTISEITKHVMEKYPNSRPCKNSSNIPGYILWMVEEISKMDRSVGGATRAARWLGWIIRVVEEDLKLWNNATSRRLVREDVDNGHDRY